MEDLVHVVNRLVSVPVWSVYTADQAIEVDFWAPGTRFAKCGPGFPEIPSKAVFIRGGRESLLVGPGFNREFLEDVKLWTGSARFIERSRGYWERLVDVAVEPKVLGEDMLRRLCSLPDILGSKYSWLSYYAYYDLVYRSKAVRAYVRRDGQVLPLYELANIEVLRLVDQTDDWQLSEGSWPEILPVNLIRGTLPLSVLIRDSGLNVRLEWKEGDSREGAVVTPAGTMDGFVVNGGFVVYLVRLFDRAKGDARDYVLMVTLRIHDE